jgi:transposase-like protein
MSGYSASKLHAIKNYWLKQSPVESFDYARVKYLVYDATYFHQDGCLLSLVDTENQKIIAHLYVDNESYQDGHPWFTKLRQRGLDPLVITVDGYRPIIRAMRQVWPEVILQRCLYHLQHEGCRWLRSHPKTEAGKALRKLLSTLCQIRTQKEQAIFIAEYKNWLTQYQVEVLSLPRTTVAFKDLQRTIVLIDNALPNMFHFLNNPVVHKTTNLLENFHSRLKSDYQRHRGLTKKHRINYLNWYCFFQNNS